MEDKKVLSLLKRGQEEYEKIQGKELHYVYVNNRNYEELVIKPNKSNFMHLCGVKYIDPKTKKEYRPKQFYEFLQKGKIDVKGIVKDKKHTEQKLQVLHHLRELSDNKIKVINRLVRLANTEFHRGFRVNRKIFCIGLVLEDRSNLTNYVPLTLLNLQTDPKADSVPTGCHVHCVYWVEDKSRQINIICKTPEFETFESRHQYPYAGKI